MPTYRYECETHGEFEFWQPMKDAALTEHSCGAPCWKVYTVLRTAGVGTHGQHYATTERTERRWTKDMAAYKRLVEKDGVQPRRIDGCDRLEATAVSKWHIETGQAHPDHKVWEGIEVAKSITRDNNIDVSGMVSR